ncbi:TFIIH/NER complex subunit [Blastocladiella emersonii ATCC 22665]|nr:TFIIH/NER complex subunit [Blastocladiella emersonii ATCC 22665]
MDISYYEEEAKVTCHACMFNRENDPTRKVKVTMCNHNICEKCLYRILRSGRGACPKCGREVKQTDVHEQRFADMTVDKEVRKRKQIHRIFNKQPREFASLREYNDYLEMVEDIVFNLTNEIDVERTNAIVEKYRRENQESIERNRLSRNPEHQRLAELRKKEEEEQQLRREQAKLKYEEEGKMQLEEKESILNELASSKRRAEDIVNDRKRVTKARGGVGSGPGASAAAHDSIREFGMAHAYTELFDPSAERVTAGAVDPLDTLDFDDELEGCFELQDNYHDPYLQPWLHGKPAIPPGGYHPNVTYFRAIESAYRGLLAPPPPPGAHPVRPDE